MSLLIQGLAGPLKDKTYPLKSGMTLGRQGEVQLLDSKASSIHARIQQVEEGQWVLEDNNSKNGTRRNGERISSLHLTPGVIFYIGDQGFEVIEIAEEPQDPTVVAVAPTAEPPPPEKVKRYWYDILAGFVERNLDSFQEGKRPVSPLRPALVLEFVKGLQTNSHWTLGYGPRQLGSTSMDLPIWEPGAPAVCFEIWPSPDGILFKTAHPEIVLLNEEPVTNQILRVGDAIRIHGTLIEVDFIE